MFPILTAMLEDENDRELMEYYYEKYRQLLFKVAHIFLNDHQQDEDCVQNTLIGLINSFQTFKGLSEEAQRKYISTICKRCAFRLNESKDDLKIEDLDESEVNSCFDSGEYGILELAEVINCLSDKYREPMIMKYKENLSTGEIAEALGISENLVYQRLNRGKIKLYEMLTEV